MGRSFRGGWEQAQARYARVIGSRRNADLAGVRLTIGTPFDHACFETERS